MDINFAQVLTPAIVSIFVGAVSAWVAGNLGVRHGLEKAKQEKAFDHRLEWQLRTIIAVKQFQLGMEEYLSVASVDREAAIPIAVKVEPMMTEFLMCTNEATLFTDRDTVIQLKKGAKEFLDMMHSTADAMKKGESWNTVLQKTAAALHKSVGSIEIELTHRHRKQLGLDPLKLEDL